MLPRGPFGAGTLRSLRCLPAPAPEPAEAGRLGTFSLRSANCQLLCRPESPPLFPRAEFQCYAPPARPRVEQDHLRYRAAQHEVVRQSWSRDAPESPSTLAADRGFPCSMVLVSSLFFPNSNRPGAYTRL